MADEPKIVVGKDLRPKLDDLDREGRPLDVELQKLDKPDSPPPTPTSHTLTDMSAEFEFFTHALITATTPFPRNVLAEWIRSKQQAGTFDPVMAPTQIASQEAFFAGIPNRAAAMDDWNYKLYAVRRDYWEDLRGFIAGVRMTNSQTGYFAMVGYYEVSVVDHFALAKMAVVDEVPKVAVTVFMTNSTERTAFLEERPTPKKPIFRTGPSQLPENLQDELNAVRNRAS